MRDFRDAKSMAKTMRADLAKDDINITHARSLELVAKAFGLADWNTLSAKIGAAGEASDEPEPLPVFSAALSETLAQAGRRAARMGHEVSGLDHLLRALADDPDAGAALEAAGVKIDGLREALEGRLAELPTQPRQEGVVTIHPDAAFQRVIRRAVRGVKAAKRSEVNGADILLAIPSEAETFAAQRLAELGFRR